MILHVATTDLSTVVMLLNSLADQPRIAQVGLVMPRWERTADGRIDFPSRYAVNAYLILEVPDRATAAAWWEEWADYVRTDLKTPYQDEEYDWIENARAS